MFRKPIAVAGVVALGLLGAISPAAAQSRTEVRFAPGADRATIEGSITGHEYADYALAARAGQTMSAELRVTGGNGDGTVYFNILPPGSDDVAIFNGSMSADGRGEVRLPEAGTYVIRVYLMGNDEDAGKVVRYAVTASVR